MQVVILQHVPFEDAGALLPWLHAHRHQVDTRHLYRDEPLPEATALDWLIVMGGPMSVHDEAAYPWLAAEKQLLRQCIDGGRRVLGICLGAQLIAEVCGATISANPVPEIGWFPLLAVGDHPLATLFADQPSVLHWHGETFSLPPGAHPLCHSSGCAQQGFVLDERVIGLQFHCEMTAAGVARLCAADDSHRQPGQWVQSAAQMLSEQRFYPQADAVMVALLAHLQAQSAS